MPVNLAILVLRFKLSQSFLYARPWSLNLVAANVNNSYTVKYTLFEHFLTKEPHGIQIIFKRTGIDM